MKLQAGIWFKTIKHKKIVQSPRISNHGGDTKLELLKESTDQYPDKGAEMWMQVNRIASMKNNLPLYPQM